MNKQVLRILEILSEVLAKGMMMMIYVIFGT